MLDFSENFFNVGFVYNAKIVNKVIAFIKFSKSERRRQAFSVLLFKMMHNVVKKNISNYRNLAFKSSNSYVPEFNELVSDCYIIMMNCVKGYKISKRHNFYFYYNKALSRNFFRDFKRELKHGDGSVMTNDDALKNNTDYSSTCNIDTIDIIFKNYNLTPIEIRLCYHKMEGKKVSDFVEQNGITISTYNKILKSIRNKIKDIKFD